MKDQLKRGLSLCSEGYADARYEIDEKTRINYRGRELDAFFNSTEEGFHVRVLSGGGLCTSSFNRVEDFDDVLKKTAATAKMTPRYRDRKIDFTLNEPATDRVSPNPEENPREIDLDEKYDLLTHYNELVLSMPKIKSTNLGYKEWVKKKLFVNVNGSTVEWEQILCEISGEIVAREGTQMENVRVSVGGGEDFHTLRDREDVFEKKAKIAAQLLDSGQVAPGRYRVLLNQPMVGLFIHEAFGHFSEADLVNDNPGLLQRLTIGAELARDFVNVIDDPGQYGRPGYYIYDDEGVRGSKTYLIKDGALFARLHSMETAFDMDEDLTGNAIAVGWKHTPIVRMSNIFIEPGESSFDDLLALVGDGLYICDGKGGSTMGDEFAFGAQYGYEVRNGKVGRMLRGINISGNLFATLKNILGVGNDLDFEEAGGCGKNGQTNPQSGTGGPHTAIDKVIIG